MKRTTYYPDSIEAIINVAPDGVESFSRRVGFLIAAAERAAAENSPELTVNEWCALVDANNGSLYSYEQGPEAVVRGVIHNVFDYAYAGNAQWEISCEDLARNLSALAFVQQLAVFEIVRGFWARKDVQEGAAGYREIFERLGAKVAP